MNQLLYASENELFGDRRFQWLLNVIEPDYLIEVFLKHPPLGFESFLLNDAGNFTPAFRASFDLLTTLSAEAKSFKTVLDCIPGARKLLQFPTLFVGCTSTEYSNYPNLSDYRSFAASLLRETHRKAAQLCIVKDIPCQSPLLSDEENLKADFLMQQLQEAGFLAVEGQALAYVPIDFESVDDYLKRLSRSRRKEFRKKLKEGSCVKIEELSCGDERFFDNSFLDFLYGMYMNVFRQSDIHFDELTREFFAALLQKSDGGGKVFTYSLDGRLIGYNLCFVQGKKLVDKYIGLVYPEAREANLYFLSWFYNLEYALKNNLDLYVAGWTDPQVKAALGASFTMTRHAVYVRNVLLRALINRFKNFLESDSEFGRALEKEK